MNEKALVFLEHIQESIQIIHEYTDDLTEERFLSFRQAQDSVIRRLEIIGEAVKNIPVEFREQYPYIP